MKIYLKIYAVVFMLAGFLFRYGFSEERVIFHDNFKEIKDLSSAGWQQIKEDIGPTKWEITEDGLLKITHCTVPYRGGRIVKAIPPVRKGYFEFEAKIGNANNQHLSLQAYLFGQLTCFNEYGTKRINWNRYEGKPVQQHFDIINHLKPDRWYKFRISFDADAKTFEFYVDDMEDPVDVHSNVPFDPDKPDHLYVIFGDYGLCSGEVINYINNIKFVEIK